MILMVTYDLHNPGRDYDKVHAKLKTADDWAHPQGSVWLLDTLQDSAWWRDQIMNAGDPNDEILVARLSGSTAWNNMDTDVVSWLKSASRRW